MLNKTADGQHFETILINQDNVTACCVYHTVSRPIIYGQKMSTLPNCPQCNSEYTYEDRNLLVCPECGNEWEESSAVDAEHDGNSVKDANGNILNDGDTVSVIRDLKVKGTSSVIKVGTKVKNIRLVEGDHDIDCKIDGFGPMKLKSEVVKKV